MLMSTLSRRYRFTSGIISRETARRNPSSISLSSAKSAMPSTGSIEFLLALETIEDTSLQPELVLFIGGVSTDVEGVRVTLSGSGGSFLFIKVSSEGRRLFSFVVDKRLVGVLLNSCGISLSRCWTAVVCGDIDNAAIIAPTHRPFPNVNKRSTDEDLKVAELGIPSVLP